MTDQNTISDLVSFYTLEFQHKNISNLTSELDSKLESKNSHISSAYEGECQQYIKSDIQAIICDVLNVNKTYLYTYGDKKLGEVQLKQINEKIIRYKVGEPLAYILGYKYFWDQKLKVTQDTLIPRADTEVLVQEVLDDLEGKFIKLNILDLGTGTGAIALALAGELKNTKVVAVDFSTKALEVARQNAVDNDITNVEFIQSDWYKNLCNMKFDIIVSNPPYIDDADNEIDAEVKVYEPASALFAKDNGLADIEEIISQAKFFLVESGCLYIEHGYTQSADVQAIFEKYGFVNIETVKDLNDKDRCTKAKAVDKRG